jgi:hypothetical protein
VVGTVAFATTIEKLGVTAERASSMSAPAPAKGSAEVIEANRAVARRVKACMVESKWVYMYMIME